MGFLSGVLSNIKEHLGQHKGTLNDAIESLRDNKHAGKIGFDAAIGKVVAGVGRYNALVERSNNAVKSQIQKMQKRVNNDFTAAIANIPDRKQLENMPALQVESKVKEAEKLAGKYVQYGKDFESDMSGVTEQIKELNNDLKTEIKNVRKNIQHEGKRLGELSANEKKALEATEDKINKTLSALKVSVDCKIGDDVRAFVVELKKKVSPIKKYLDDITTKVSQYVIELQTWMENTKKYINEIRDTNVKKILNEAGADFTSRRHNIEDERKMLLKWKDKLDGYVSKLADYNNQVKQSIETLAKNFDASPECINAILEDIKLQVERIKENVGEKLKEPGPTDPDDSIYQNWDAMKEEVRQVVDSLTKQGNSSLTVVVKGIKGFAGKFKKGEEYLGKIVEGWVADIIKKEPVSGFLTEYFKDNKSSGYFSGPLKNDSVQGLGKHVIPNLTGSIKDTVNQIAPATNFDGTNTMEEKLSYIKTYLTQISNTAMSKGEEIASQVSSYVQYQHDLVNFRGGGVPKPYHLKLAVKATLATLASVAMQVSQQLDTLKTTSKITPNLETAVAHVEDLGRQIEGGKSYGSKIDLALELVTSELDTLHVDLLNAVPDRGGGNLVKPVDNAIGKVSDTVTELAANIIPLKLDNIAQQIEEHLNVLTHEITEAANIVNAKLENFIDLKIGKPVIRGEAKADTLQAIYDKLDKLQKDPVSEAVKLTNNLFDQYLAAAETHYTKRLTEYVDSQVKDVTEKLIHHTREQYITAVTTLLEDYTKKVAKDLEPLPQAITNDLHRGHKKFMSMFESKFVKKYEDIASIDGKSTKRESPLSQAVKILYSTFRRLPSYLKSDDDFKSDISKIKPSNDALVKLFEDLKTSEHFDHTFSENVDTVMKSFEDFRPSEFGEPTTVLSQSLKEGIGALVTELDKTYVSSYSGVKYEGPLVTEETIDRKTIDLTAYGTKLSKVCLSITPILFGTLDELKNALENEENSWNTYTVYNSTRPTKGLCHLFFRDHGYDSGCESTIPYGELNHKSEFTGRNIYKHLTEGARKLFESSDNLHIVATLRDGSHAIPVEYSNGEGLIPELSGYHKLYAQVSHLIFHPKRRSPCNVYEMLLWCAGLQFNSVYNKLHDHCDSLFAKRKDEHMPDVEIPLPIDAHPKPIYATDIGRAIEHITSHAYMLLTGILGTGDAATYYACDFPINTLNLTYPTSGGDCLQMLLDVLRTLCPALKYLCMRCKLGPSDCGWARCLYGKSVSPANWQCKEHSNNKAACQPNCQVNDQPTCQPRSPLMSYLNDCLPGHLPHRLISVGCKSECRTCPSGRPGMPCVTPLGFRAFSGSTKTGSDLSEIIEMFFGDDLVSSLFCLGTKPPASLPEHVSFALSLVSGWRNVKNHSLKIAVESHVAEVSINLCDKPYVITSALGNAYGYSVSDHGSFHPKEDSADLASLSMRMTCATQQCGPYLYSLSTDMYKYMANKNANLFLSWCLYLPWQLLECLQNLCDEFNDIFCQDWGCDRCLRDDKCKKGKHGVADAKSKKPNCDCTSVVNCKGVSPTLYRYGFAFGNAFTLNNRGTNKTCSDFHTQLQNVLKSRYFEKLFATIDHFMFTIRAPFLWTTVALWSLSLFYLICVMVGRLDVLHIRSHLRIPSSHKITAQSLLAAAQVGRLAKISYLQP